MNRLRFTAFLAVALPLCAQQIDVGTGAPNEAIRQRFIQAFYRNGFYTLVALPPKSPVQSFGGTGLIQLFGGAADPEQTYAIVKSNTSTAYPTPSPGQEDLPIDTFQVLGAMYAYYSSMGVGTVGFPTTDTLSCPPTSAGACQYQLFDKKYALFVYQGVAGLTQRLSVRDPFYSTWTALGGIYALGPATSAETTVTSSGGSSGVIQTFANGMLVRITSGTYSGRSFAIQQPVWDLYQANNGYSGLLGFPISDELTLADGRRRQNFEGGSVEYMPGSAATLRLPVHSINLQPSVTSLRLNLGEAVTLRAVLYAANGIELTDRVVNWTTSNGRVVSIQVSGYSATLKGVGGGVAVVRATCEGKESAAITVVVSAPCCQVGEGAPTAAIQQAFEDAVTRNRLSLQLPTPNPVRRVGNGYLQEFTDSAGARWVIAKPDRSPAAYVLTGAILRRWEEVGGATGSLGYPSSDPTPGGRQMFENNAALAGSPVRVVSGTILYKWGLLGYENGAAGPPVAEAADFLSFAGTAGSGQAFRDGVIYAARTGTRAGQAWLVRGLLLAKYLSMNGPAGALGAPVGDDFQIEGRTRQQFEGGELEYAPGDSEARASLKPRQPLVSVSPSVVTPGATVRITVGGFSPGATLRISVTGLPDFEVHTPTGAYTWERYVSPATPSGRVTIRATSGSESVEGAYQVRAVAEQRLQLTKVGGDAQTGLPGALLPQPLRVLVRDEAGNPVANVTVRFTASPGAQLTTASAVTDATGEAQTRLRLPASEGVALVAAEAVGQVVTFSARAAAGSLANFPRILQSGSVALGRGPATIAEKGPLLVAVASIIRYYQDQGALPAVNGLAEPLLLNDYLSRFCTIDAQGLEVCDGYLEAPGSGDPTVNLWRLAGFVAGNLQISPEKPEPPAVRDLLAQGAPVLLALALNLEGRPAGAHFVIATGVRADGAILIQDPNPAFGRTLLEEYLSGFALSGKTWQGSLTAALRLIPATASPTGFLVVGGEVSFEVTSATGRCGQTLEWPATVATPQALSAPPGLFRARYCEGSQPFYQLDVAAQGAYQLTVTDLGNLGSRFQITGGGASAYRLNRPLGRLAVAPMEALIEANGVVNAASFTAAIAPGGLMAIFGSGLARQGARTEVEIGGLAAPVLAATPFQLNVEVPAGLPAGTHSLRIRSPYGSVEQTVTLQPVAPAIFQLEGGLGAILNQDGKLNSPRSPARRGQAVIVYCTGLGAVSRAGSLSVTVEPVSVLVDGIELPAAFAGLAPGFRGLYQVNVLLPQGIPPRLDAALRVKQGQAVSNEVPLAIE